VIHIARVIFKYCVYTIFLAAGNNECALTYVRQIVCSIALIVEEMKTSEPDYNGIIKIFNCALPIAISVG